MDVTIRFNDDYENDFIFEVQKDQTVNNYLRKIFNPDGKIAEMLPLRPSIYYSRVPTKFYKSIHPGILTPGGALLFNFDSTDKEFLVELDPEVPLIEQLWPGQLIVPKWNIRYFNIFRYILFCSAWLYTDLPDFISPTPGHCFTNYISWALIPFMNWIEKPEFADKLRSEIAPNSSGHIAQIIFFTLHVVKILIMTLFFGLGMANPISFNLMKIRKSKNVNAADESVRKVLKEIGWTGLKRAPYDVYKKDFYDFVMKRDGGLVGSYKAGTLKRAANPGTILEKGEGFSTPLSRRGDSTFEVMEKDHLYILSTEYYVQIEKDLEAEIDKCGKDIDKINGLIRNFKRYGLLNAGERIGKIINEKEEMSGKFAIFEEAEKKKQK
ncbi:glucose-signaling factor 2 [Monosporozyma unispora]|nr:glucose repression protein [Kazachstania unispora]